MNDIQFSVSHQKLTPAGRPFLVGNSRDYLTATFQFSEDWTGLAKVVFFSKSKDETYAFMLVDDAIAADQHLNLSSGDWDVWMYGFAGEVEDISQLPTDVMRISTNKTRISVGINGSSVGDVLEDDPASLGDQILAAAQKAVNTADSVREDADNGRFNGKDGRDGHDGADGPVGPRGYSGVYIGETEPTDANVWIAPGGKASIPATQAWVLQLLQQKRNVTPTLSDTQKDQLVGLARAYESKNSAFRYHRVVDQLQHSKAATRNDYASASTAISDNAAANGRYKINCSLFTQLVWMGRKADDFPYPNTDGYTNDIHPAFDWGYYFNFPLRKRVYGLHRDVEGTDYYYGFTKPHDSDYEGSRSFNTHYTGTDDPTGKLGQTYDTYMGASEMARELYEMGCEIPYSELDRGDLVFFRTPSIADGKDDESEWVSFRNINHVAIVHGFYTDVDGIRHPKFMECVEAFDNTPIMYVSCELPSGGSPGATGWQATRCSALMRWAVMCARHPAAFGKGGNVPGAIDPISTVTEVSE